MGAIRVQFHGVQHRLGLSLSCVVLLLLTSVAGAESDEPDPPMPTDARIDLADALFATPIQSAVFSPQSDKVILVSKGGYFGVWHTKNGVKVRLDDSRKSHVVGAAITRDGKSLSVLAPTSWYKYRYNKTNSHILHRWDLTTGKKLESGKYRVSGRKMAEEFVPSLDAWMWSGHLYDTKTGEELCRISLGESWGCVASGNGRFIATVAAEGITVYDLSKSATVLFTKEAPGWREHFFDPVSDRVPLRFSYGSQALLIPRKEYISVWNLEAQCEAYRMPIPSTQGRIVVFSDDGLLLAESDQWGIVTLWDLVQGKRVLRFDTDMGRLARMAMSTNGRYLVTCGRDTNETVLWDMNPRYHVQHNSDATPQTVDQAWNAMGSASPMEGYEAQWTFLQMGEAGEKWLEEKIRSAGILEGDISKWTKQLGASKYAQRKQAKEKLLAIGAPAVPAIQSLARTSRDPEVIMLARELLKKGIAQAGESAEGRRALRANTLIWRLRSEREAREAVAYRFPKYKPVERPNGMWLDWAVKNWNLLDYRLGIGPEDGIYASSGKHGSLHGAIDHAAKTGQVFWLTKRDKPHLKSADFTKVLHLWQRGLDAEEMDRFAARKDIKNIRTLKLFNNNDPYVNYGFSYQFPKLEGISGTYKLGPYPEREMKPMPNLLSLCHSEHGKELKSFEFLRKFPNLRRLCLSGYVLGQEQPLPAGANPKLEVLHIAMWKGLTTKQLDAYLAGNQNLTDLELKQPFGDNEQDLTFLSKYRGLKTLRILDDIGPNVAYLESLVNMERLAISLERSTCDIGFLAKMPKLRHVFLRTHGSKVENLNALTNHPSLETISVWGGRELKDISALATCKKLIYVGVTGSSVTLADLRAFQKAMPNCYIEQLAPKKKQR